MKLVETWMRIDQNYVLNHMVVNIFELVRSHSRLRYRFNLAKRLQYNHIQTNAYASLGE
jgi:hypothetical protein